jgi:hypothetical protein
MKTLEEKKLLVKMARAFNQPVDPLILESIEQEERFAKLLFKEQTTPVIQEAVIDHPLQMIVEANPLPPPAFVPPTTVDVIQQTVNVLNTANANTNSFKDKEIEGMRRTIAEMMQKISTLSWGGGGTGIVRVFDADDFDRNTVGEGKFMKFSNGWFVLDDINPSEIVHNTTIVNSNTYVVANSDYYIGVNNASYTTITLPSTPVSGRMVIIKDESGNAQLYPIKLDGNVDNDPGGAEIRINNGGVQLIYRNGWRIV